MGPILEDEVALGSLSVEPSAHAHTHRRAGDRHLGQQATALAASGAAGASGGAVGGCGGMRGLLMDKELREDGTPPHTGLSRAPTAFKHL